MPVLAILFGVPTIFVAVVRALCIWPHGHIYYFINPPLAKVANFVEEFYKITSMIEEATCIRFMKLRRVDDEPVHIFQYLGCTTHGIRNETHVIVPFRVPATALQNCNNHFNQYSCSQFDLSMEGDASSHNRLFFIILLAIGLFYELPRVDRSQYIKLEGHLDKEKSIMNDWPPKGIEHPPYSSQTMMHYELNPSRDRRFTVSLDSKRKFSEAFGEHIYVIAEKISALYEEVFPSACKTSSYC